MIEHFVRYLQAERSASPNTVEAYRRDLMQWRAWALGGRPHDEFAPAAVTAADIRAWIASLGKVSTLTRRRKLQSVRAFYRWMMRTQGLATNPAADIRAPKRPEQLPVYARTVETLAMLDEHTPADADAALPQERFTAHRDSLILELLYATGMRVSELATLTDANVNTHAGTLRILGKRAKERIVPCAPRLATLIDTYREARDTLFGPCHTLLVNRHGEPMTRHSIYRIVHRAMQSSNLHAARLSPHLLRHCCATDLLNAGAELTSVSTLLGHASLATTQLYTHMTFRDLCDAYSAAHPRAKHP